MTKILAGHDSPETAYVVADYPYGFRLRCKIRYWLERNPKHGVRLVSQTTNPKRGDIWNKPKASTYSEVMAMFLDDENHVQSDSLTPYSSAEQIEKFHAHYFSALNEKDHERIKFMGVIRRAQSRITVTVGGDGPHQTIDEQRAIMRRAIGAQLAEETRKDGG